MATKLQVITQYAHQVVQSFSSRRGAWQTYLKTAAQVYKYPFRDQILIYAQRPDAIACASMELWNQKMGRWVNQGARGIALLDDTGQQTKLHYVFDVTDTHPGRYRSSEPQLWHMEPSHQRAIAASISQRFGVTYEENIPFAQQICTMSAQIVANHLNDYLNELHMVIPDSFLEELDDLNLSVHLKTLLTNSVAYTILTRCGIDAEDYFDHEDFAFIHDFSSYETISVLGNATTTISKMVLLEIGRTIQAQEQKFAKQQTLIYDGLTKTEAQRTGKGNQSHENRTDLHPERGLSVSKSHPSPAAGLPASGQIRDAAQDISETTQTHAVRSAPSGRQTGQPSDGNRPAGNPVGRATHSADGSNPRGERGAESLPSDGVGTGDEQPESSSGGSGIASTDLPLNPQELNQSPSLVEHVVNTSSTFFIGQDVIDQCLRHGGNTDNQRMQVIALFQKDLPISEIATRLPTLYHGGNGMTTEQGAISVWFGEDGIRLAYGDRARYEPSAQVLTWEHAAQRIGALLECGQFSNRVELLKAEGYERTLLAQSFLYLYHDINRETGNLEKLSSLFQETGDAFSGEVQELANRLAEPAFRNTLRTEYKAFLAVYHQDSSIMRFHYHKFDELLQRLEELDLPRKSFSSTMLELPSIQPFITEDEIEEALSVGSHYEDGQKRIYHFFQEPHDNKEKADFLKHEYGIGGRSHALSGATYSSEDYDSKGIRYGKQDCPTVTLTWETVAKRVEHLIRADRYLAPPVSPDHQVAQPNSQSIQVKPYHIPLGSTVYIGTQAYELQELGETKVVLYDPNFPLLPQVFDRTEFDRKLRENPLNEPYFPLQETVQPEENHQIETETQPESTTSPLTDEAYAQTYLIPHQTEFEQDGRRYRVEQVKPELDKVELTDLSFEHTAGFPIVRVEKISTLRAYLETSAPPEPPKQPKQTSDQSKVIHPDQTNRHNYRITDPSLGIGTPSQRYQNNIAAIRLLKELEQEQRLATPEEQEILAQYVGWGGLADRFEETHRNYSELKTLLTQEEYEAARESTLTAFYTPPVVIHAMYQALEQLGFQTGNVLEPACGTGNFLGMLPQSMSNATCYGIELDQISGRIAQQLYQTASITIQGYEKTQLPDNFFEIAIGNIPFGNFKVADRRYDKHNFLIHDYFFGRTLDKVRPGGIIAFVTSKGTLDKENPAVRKYLAQRADLLGAIRLPNNTFQDAAGTQVTSDILFLQKRASQIDLEPVWVHLGVNENGISMNQYFIEHPEMVLGEMKEVSGPYGKETACVPIEGQELSDLLASAIDKIHGSIWEYEREGGEAEPTGAIPADPSVKNFSYTIVDGEVYYRENSRMNPVEVSSTALGRIKGLIGLRDCVRQLIAYQTDDVPEQFITEQQQTLNQLYDAFVKQYGRIAQRANHSAFHADSAYFLLCSLEVTDGDGNFVRKADMFTKRTIRQKPQVTHVDTASEALALSLAEKACIDIPYMQALTGKTEDTLVSELHGVMFRLPASLHTEENPVYVTADEYLSGNVRQKLREAQLAARTHAQFQVNVDALTAVQPTDLTPSEISVRLGATWLPPQDVTAFLFELFDTPNYAHWNIKVHYSELTGAWNIEGKNYDRTSIKANSTYGTSRINGYKIVEETLNLKDVRIFDYVEDEFGKRTAVLNKKETAIAQAKQQLIKQAFEDWIWKDPERRERLSKLYNETFNAIRPREYDGSHLNFVGMNPEITLRQHQVNAIAHILYGGNTLLAHVVGGGKTFEIVAAAQESKRLGLCSKSLIAVPNHLTEQWASEYLQLYPSANILVATKKDFEPKNRKKFCGRIATGDYDAIIIGHSQLEKIPMSLERQRAILEEQLQEIVDGIGELKRSRGDNFSIKQMERTRKILKTKLDKLNDQSRKDDVVTFEELGVDRLFVDEAHQFKNLAAYTKMRNVGGISQTEAQKSSDLYMKCRYLDELTGGRGVIFATGTPISNSMVELYTMQKYLQHDRLQKHNLLHFDAWASTFGETVTAIELAPEGSGYRAKTRFAKFYNLPELMSLFREVADIQTSDMLKLPVPKANYHHVVLKPSEQQQEMVSGLSERAERVRNKMVDSSVDNMLLITNDGRKLALDQRLLNPLLPDSETGKVRACADNIYSIWLQTADQKATQLAFCDLSTPKSDGSFNVYDDLRDKLIAKGIPAEEIAYIHNANTEQQKKELFSKVCSGTVRVLLGSTAKMGAGTNVQRKLIALHHLDCPWRPADLQQREGRIIRQGNEHKEVEIYTYVTENTFDSYLFQLVESKQKFIGQIMTSKSPVRSAEDIDETALSYAEIKALCTGNPHIKEKMDLDIDVGRLKLLKANHLSQKYSLEDQILKDFPHKIATLEQRIAGYRQDMEHLAEKTNPNPDGFSPMVIHKQEFVDKKAAGNAILEECMAMTNPDPVTIGSYRGFELVLSFDRFNREYQLTLCHALRHTVKLGTDLYGNIQRIDHVLDGFETRLNECTATLEHTKVQLEHAKVEVQKPFAQEEELTLKSARLDKLNALLNLDHKENELPDPSTDELEEVSQRQINRNRGTER